MFETSTPFTDKATP